MEQIIEGHRVKVVRLGGDDHNRHVLFMDGRWKGHGLPLALASISAGSDAWCQKVKARCLDCGEHGEIGERDNVDYCQDCMEKEYNSMEMER